MPHISGSSVIYYDTEILSMEESISKTLSVYEIAISAVFAAVVFAATVVMPIPVPATGGYINLGDSMIFVSALLFGARVGGFAGGIGSCLADIYLGFGMYAPITLVVKGIEGFVVGHFSKKDSVYWSIFAVIVGGLVMVTGYFIAEAFLVGIPNALVEVPGNLFQAGAGLLIAVPFVKAIRKALPQKL